MPRGAIRIMGGTKIVPIANPVSWQRKAFAYRTYPRTADNPTAPMLAAQIKLAEAAHAAYGDRGMVGGLPVVAARVRAACSGADYGGKSREERAREAHDMAGSHIDAMKRTLSRM